MTNINGFLSRCLGLLDASITVTIDYKSLHIKLLLNNVCLTNLYAESRTDLDYSDLSTT
jgi:hypothetical protein